MSASQMSARHELFTILFSLLFPLRLQPFDSLFRVLNRCKPSTSTSWNHVLLQRIFARSGGQKKSRVRDETYVQGSSGLVANSSIRNFGKCWRAISSFAEDSGQGENRVILRLASDFARQFSSDVMMRLSSIVISSWKDSL